MTAVRLPGLFVQPAVAERWLRAPPVFATAVSGEFLHALCRRNKQTFAYFAVRPIPDAHRLSL